jgi:hypothetical protein
MNPKYFYANAICRAKKKVKRAKQIDKDCCNNKKNIKMMTLAFFFISFGLKLVLIRMLLTPLESIF